MVRINDANVTTADIMASNGVIHVIDTVLLPPSMSSQAPAMATADIVDTAVAAGHFTTLATALNAAGLVDTLKGPGPFTVFAPTDAAFAKLPAGTLESLLANPDQLRMVLTYHVVAGADYRGRGESAPASRHRRRRKRHDPGRRRHGHDQRRHGDHSPISWPATASSTSSIPCCCRRLSPPAWLPSRSTG